MHLDETQLESAKSEEAEGKETALLGEGEKRREAVETVWNSLLYYATTGEKISLKVHNPSKIPLNVSTQTCYAFVGQNSNNATLCEKAGALKSSCLEGVNQK